MWFGSCGNCTIHVGAVTPRLDDRITLVNYGGGVSTARVATGFACVGGFVAESGQRTQSPTRYDLLVVHEGTAWIRGWHRRTSPRALAMLAAYALAGHAPLLPT